MASSGPTDSCWNWPVKVKMCSTPKSETSSKTSTTSSTKFNQDLTSSTGPTSSSSGNVANENLSKIKTAGPGENSVSNNNNNNSGKTSSTTCAKNKQARRTNFQEISEGEVDGKSPTAFGGAAAVSLKQDARSSGPSALTTTLAAGLGRSATGSRLAPGNQPIFGGGGGGKGMRATTDADSDPVYSKTGELIDNYGQNNAIISGSNSLTKRKNAKVLNIKSGPAQVSNNSKKKANNKLNSSGPLKSDSDFFLTTASGGKTCLSLSDFRLKFTTAHQLRLTDHRDLFHDFGTIRFFEGINWWKRTCKIGFSFQNCYFGYNKLYYHMIRNTPSTKLLRLLKHFCYRVIGRIYLSNATEITVLYIFP